MSRFFQDYTMDRDALLIIISIGVIVYVGICLCIVMELCRPKRVHCSHCEMEHRPNACPLQLPDLQEPLPVYEARPPSYK
jgi:hypothetical protein